jgi:hypothetical protein
MCLLLRLLPTSTLAVPIARHPLDGCGLASLLVETGGEWLDLASLTRQRDSREFQGQAALIKASAGTTIFVTKATTTTDARSADHYGIDILA